MLLKNPYPWFGGKSIVAPDIWKRLGNPINFIDPFFGGGAILLQRPEFDPSAHCETINDINGFIPNFWRAIKHAPDAVAEYADSPVMELDLHARHDWLIEHGTRQEFVEKLRADPGFYDAKIAGWWVWGICAWIGDGWCEARKEQLPYLGDKGRGVHRASRQLPHLGDKGQGVHRTGQKRPHLGNRGRGVHRSTNDDIYDYFQALSTRLRRVRVCCGDWSRVVQPSVTALGLTAILLDPPYAGFETLYGAQPVSDQVREWAIENGNNPKLRIALCGYEDEHPMPDNWECFQWKAQGGYGQNGNEFKERIWFSPHCLKVDQRKQLSLLEAGSL